MKNKTTAAILAFLLGGVGAHKFYLGQNGRGIIYLLFCWTFIPALIAFVEFFVLITMDDKHFDLKYNPYKNLVLASHANVGSELEKLHELKEKGIITEEEFNKKKQQLL